MIKQDVLFETLKEAVLCIDSELRQLNNTGIFFAPELYIAFCLGRDIYKNRDRIFGTSDVKWLRETNLGNGGPSDICFEVENRKVVFELKLRDTSHAYNADVEKLKRLTEIEEKFFCVLLDKIKDDDGRLLNLVSMSQSAINNVGQYNFPTWNNWYSSNVSCSLNLFKVL